MTAAAFLLAATILGLLWLRSGHDPLYWLVRSIILLRAILAQAGAEFWRGCRRWWRAMPAAIRRSSWECLGETVPAEE
jgi:hypothetical protein